MDRIGMIRLLRAYSWDKVGWYAPLKECLEGVDSAAAAWQPPGGGNSIWQTVNHINHYNEQLVCRMTNRPFAAAGKSNDETFGPAGDPGDAAGWQTTLELTARIAQELAALFGQASDSDLDVKAGEGTRLEGLTAWIMHDAYHTGQVALIRKMQGWGGITWS